MNYSDGWIIDDLIIFGGLDEKGYVSKGFSLECPNVQNASNDFKNLFADRMKNALITLYQIKPAESTGAEQLYGCAQSIYKV
jgi:hypothetical protein